MMLGKLLSGVVQKSLTAVPCATKEVGTSLKSIIPSGLNLFWNTTSVRTIVRYHFPRPNERMRIKKHGWKTRMSTPEGRRTIMNRIIKGYTVLTH